MIPLAKVAQVVADDREQRRLVRLLEGEFAAHRGAGHAVDVIRVGRRYYDALVGQDLLSQRGRWHGCPVELVDTPTYLELLAETTEAATGETTRLEPVSEPPAPASEVARGPIDTLEG